MRRIALVLLVLCASPLFAYEVRSDQFALAIDVRRVDDGLRYPILVTDVVTGEILVSDELEQPMPDGPVQTTIEAGDLKLSIRIRVSNGKLNAELDVDEDGMVVDMLRAQWLIGARPAQKPTEGPLPVGGDVRAPLVIKRVEPLYTAEAKAARISGIVILELVVDREGNVSDARVLKPLPYGLDETALAAVRQWKFEPGTLNDEPVDVVYNLIMNFKLDE